MKKHIYSILYFLSIGLVIFAQNPDKMKLDSISAEGIAYHTFGYDDRGNMLYYYSTVDTNIYTYDDNNNILSDTYIGFAQDTRYVYTYDANNNVLSSTRYHHYTGTWDEESRMEKTYNANNKVVDQIEYRYQGQWQPLNKLTHIYDSLNYLVKVIRYNFSNSSWSHYANSTNLYDNNYNLVLTLDSSNYGPSGKTEYTYDERNNNLSKIIYARNSVTEWKYKNKIESTYDMNNNTLSTISFVYENDAWEEVYRTEYTFDANSNCTSITKPTRKEEYTFDGNNNCLSETYSTKELTDTAWTYQVRHSYTYDENNNKTVDLMTQFYDDQWNNNSKNDYIYDYSYDREDLILPLDYYKMNNMLTIVNSYTWTDYDWRLPFLSTFHYSLNTISLNDISVDNSIAVYPNPAQDYISFKLKDNNLYIIELYNSNGVLVLSETTRRNCRLDVFSLKRGVYFYKVIDKNKTAFSGKIIKL
ncbi:MAG: type sorting protein [Bacteroidetes bacterium]|nr:type sorting protein [Bacteroidota bacterium]